MSSIDEAVYKLKEFSLWNDVNSEAKYNSAKWTIESLLQNLRIEVKEIDDEKMEMEFDLSGVGPPIANAIRRILIAEVATMAIDRVHMYNNTTVIPDEVLAHRLGLIPIKVDPRIFVRRSNDDDEVTEEDTIQFELKVKCTKKPNAPKTALLPDDQSCNHSKVKSCDLKFIPLGNQKEMLGDVRPVHEDILISVMKPGHEIDLKAFCFKNIGREHAKFSPVVVASYRLLPELRLLSEITGDRAETLAKCFPEGVVKVSEKHGRKVAKVKNSRKINCSRNVFLHEDLKNDVEICKVKDHYIFTVESAGALPADVLVTEAIGVLKEKCRTFLAELKSLET